LDSILTEVVSSLASKAVYSAILAAVMGGILTIFKPFVLSDESVRQRVNLHRKRLVERLRQSYKRILGDAFVLAPPANSPDPVEDHVEELFRITMVLNRLDRLHITAVHCYTWLFVTAVVGCIGFCLSWTDDLIKACVALVCSVAIIIQIIIFYLLRRVAIRLGECEETT